ncbi:MULTISPECIES: hypothetical protein [unclassified Lentimicrobium]|uniref:hypothetical protein n=1 Tax=unclassified Lentimicrobium TaxID=2677434 RepID=UPI00155259DD|nr:MULTISPECIES: hypothetical protein [unclassified Lentimicrobium]NPD44187.1 hypothetical protein [Lentimicrobium sp. S6]NPD84645.1 hypothetical protein [Lentimicrobium sp. L6]
MIILISIVLVVVIGGLVAFRTLKKDNPELRIYRKHYSCSICGAEFNQTLDYCPECANERQTTVLLHEFFVEVNEGKQKVRLT